MFRRDILITSLQTKTIVALAKFNRELRKLNSEFDDFYPLKTPVESLITTLETGDFQTVEQFKQQAELRGKAIQSLFNLQDEVNEYNMPEKVSKSLMPSEYLKNTITFGEFLNQIKDDIEALSEEITNLEMGLEQIGKILEVKDLQKTIAKNAAFKLCDNMDFSLSQDVFSQLNASALEQIEKLFVEQNLTGLAIEKLPSPLFLSNLIAGQLTTDIKKASLHL